MPYGSSPKLDVLGDHRIVRVFAARRAAALRPRGPFVRAARRADARRAEADRRRAADLAWRESAFRDAARRPSRRSAREIARERRPDGRRRCEPARAAYFALCRVLGFDPRGGGGSFTPALRAFDRPIAIACLVDRAPCFPRRTCSISSRTYAPACVVGALPLFLACRARFIVRFSGIASSVRCPAMIAAGR
jgi:hypothetical protein